MADGIEVDPASVAQLNKLAAAYKGGDKVLRREISKGLREAAKPTAREILTEAAEGLPHTGGLSARVAAGSASIAQSLGGSTVGVSISLRGRKLKNLRAIDNGTVRHPVYGRDKWVSQRVTPHLFTDAFERHAPEARRVVDAAVQDALNQIGNEA